MFKVIHYCLHMYLKSLEAFELCELEIYELDSAAHFLSAPGLAWQVCLKIQE